jgi:RNA polymerase sigma-70 factor (ECF subfamily)
MTWRLAINRRRADQRRNARESSFSDAAVNSSPDDASAVGERARLLWQAIDALPDKLRIAIVLAGIEGRDVQEVAVLLGVPEGTVKSRLFLARKRLKELLQWAATTPKTS